jgi:hypothetical protein
MAIVVGKIQPLKKLRESLERQGITRFNSVGDINLFLMSYDTEKRDIPSAEKSKLDSEIHTLQESIEVDHLLIGPAGVYIIETKNWGAQSVQNLDLRSPVDQIKRSSYALFVSLNSASDVGLAQHHWGRKKVPIRSIIAMTNSMPREEFQHVKVLSISKINAYITYFEPIFSDTEVERLFNHLCRLSNKP